MADVQQSSETVPVEA